MMSKLNITVKGKFKEWGFTFHGDPKDIAQYRRDGLNVDEVLNSAPESYPTWLSWLVFRFQDFRRWLNG
tara:strand:- start:31 stop:237 length:207 start_codon:yes stop_codon:yes gene_type:complete